MKRLEDRDWWAELVELRNVMSLRELGERFGAAPAAISNALKRNGMNRDGAPPGPRSRRSDDVKLAAAAKLADMGLAPLATDAAASLVEPAAKAPAPEVAAPAPAVAKAPKAAPEAAPKAAPKAAPAANGVLGYQAMIGDQAFVIVAADIAEAARIARDSSRGQVRAVELLGKALAS